MDPSADSGVQPIASANLDGHLRTLAELMPQIVWLADASGSITYVNKVWSQVSGLTSAPESPDWFLKAIHPDDQDAWRKEWKRAASRGQFEVIGRLHQHSNDLWTRHLHHAVAIRSQQDRILQWFGTSANIDPAAYAAMGEVAVQDERFRVASELNDHLLRLLRERSAVVDELQAQTHHLNEVISAQTFLAQAELELESFMTIVVERMLLLTSATGSVVELVEEDEMVYRAASGTVRPYVGLRLKRGGSLSGLCVGQGQALHCHDTETDPRVDLPACRKIGVRSMIVTPLLNHGMVVGVLKILSNNPNAFSRNDLQTLQLMAGLIGAAISHQQRFEVNQHLLQERTKALSALAQEVERRTLSEETLRASEARIRMIIDSSGEAFVAMNEDGVVTEWNRQAELTFGWPATEILGKYLHEVLLPAHQKRLYLDLLAKQVEQPLVGGSRSELVTMSATGAEILTEMTLTCIRTGRHFLFSAFLRDISARRQHELRLRHMAEHDQLTGLPNRAAFLSQLDLHLESTGRRSAAVLFIDLDGFKAINDQFGHDHGDLLLKEVAKRLTASVRDSDLLARFGGDEFVVLLTGLSQAELDAKRVADTIIIALSESVTMCGRQVQVGASIGIAAIEPDRKAEPHTLIQRADAAMYVAKRAGKNRACIWLPELT